MNELLALRPFLPARDMAKSRAFYEALGFRATHSDDTITIIKRDSFSFILQAYYVQEWAENTMLQILVRDVEPWWAANVDAARLVAEFGVREPKAPEMQKWGLIVGFLFDPSGVLWHVAEAPF
jgi:catechol 2,3-dioxygenase-like lactoylglutathione lyase family enzyme